MYRNRETMEAQIAARGGKFKAGFSVLRVPSTNNSSLKNKLGKILEDSRAPK